MIRFYPKRQLIYILTFLLFSVVTEAGNPIFKEIKRFNIPEARQGVAVDESYFYAIGTREIAKYEKHSGDFISRWKESKKGPIIHLDSGVIIEGKLFCAHSNYPGVPMTSSIEVWDAETLEHIGTHSFGINWGSCTWVDRYKGYWWAVFANYDKLKLKSKTDKGSEWTTLVMFDNNWQAQESWTFPQLLIDKFSPMSNSGGSWGEDGFLYCTGHDNLELYVLQLPNVGSVLELVNIIPINNSGQGIAWDRSDSGKIYTIHKKKKDVIVFKYVSNE